ncbi:uncharacterized protein LOC123535609 isoform X2 [Mercenaria mercenaria]|uniref:uncharacterized protein LOC123535609 isoform X2 n=1 Tax=Mercenaria mercenaria TaxID=6596 RepID=UPI00234EC373|nr:uncharacterized protein LOC123535609 isoform X2 [Mercenaria mercenaria]
MKGHTGKPDRLQPLRDLSREPSYLSRENTYLSQREQTFFNLKEPTLLAAEDGRKRASTLPPLEREPTFHRKPKHFNPYDGTHEDAADSHWKKNYEKVSIEVDNKVKHHLKRQLMHRFEKRLKKMEEAMSDDLSGRHGKDYNPWEGKHGKQKKNRDIFSKYTETGAKAGPEVASSTKEDKAFPEIQIKNESVPDGKQNLQNARVQFPDINQNGDINGVHSDGEASLDSIHNDSDHEELEKHENNDGVFDLTRLKTKYAEQSFRHMDVSPVQTPHVQRPMTREQTRLSFGDKIKRILNGEVHVSCPTINKSIRLYLCSGFSDSEAERTILAEKVFPELRTLCLLHGKELQTIDPHRGLGDALVDDHSIPDMCLSNIQRCTEDHLQSVNSVVILTDRYGDPILPSSLQIEEFEYIHNAVTSYTNANKAKIHEQIAMLENPSSLKERRLSQEHPKDGAKTDITNGDIQPKGEATGQVTQEKAPATHKKEDGKKEQQLIKALKDEESQLPDPSLLETWYRLDENSIPAVYKLQNISSILKDFGKGDASKREYAKQAWLATQSRLLDMINRYGTTKYNKSLLEYELNHVLQEHDTSLEQCIVITREIDDIDDNLDDLRADEYADVTSGKPRKRNWNVYNRLRKLKQETLPQKVLDQYILPFQTSWASGGVRVGGDRMHQTYLDRMGKHVCDVIKRRLLEGFKEEGHDDKKHSKLFDEVSEHVLFYQQRSQNFQGRKETLHVMKSYLRSTCHSVLVVHGRPGCGKSSVLAKAAKETHRWLRGQDVATVVRSVGSTKESTNIRNLLYNICQQLSLIYNAESSQVPTDYVGLINDFSQRMSLATERKPLVLFIDALDRLEDDHDGRKLSWLPKTLPDNVHLIVSTLPDEKFDCMPSLKTLLGDNADVFLELPELLESDTMIILNHWCNIHNHTLTQEQFDIIFNVMKKCPTPLFLKLLFNEALKWASYTDVQESKLPDSVKKMAAIKFGQLEIKYGEALVRRAIGYIAASRNGVTDHEMLDLLSLDDAVMGEIAPHYNLVRRRVPSSLWYRIREELVLYIKEVKADNVKTLQWSHSHFHEAAKERYLIQRDKAPSYHKVMADYFLGTWVTKPKPYPGNDKGVLRYVSEQPLYWEPKDAINDGSMRVYNLRKINELPHHLLLSNLMQQYKTETMCNFEWVLAKLCGTSLRSLVEEYHIGLEMEPSDLDLKLMSDTLQLSATAIQRDPRQLAGQVVGRLQGIVNRDIPSTPGDPPRYPFIHSMVTQAKNTSIPALVPSIGCLTEPGGILYDLLSGHTKLITAVTTTTDAQRALTASEDNTLKVWDLKSGKVTSTIDSFGKNVSKLRTALNNKYVISVEGSVIKVWSLADKECCLVVDQYLDPPVLSVAGEGKLLVAFFQGVNALKTWDLSDQFRHVCETKIEGENVFSDNSVVLAPNSYGDYVLLAFRGANSAMIQHARTGKVLHKLKCHDDSSSIVALAITRDYMILACRQHYMKLHEIHQLEMFDAKKGKYLRSIRGCTQDIITEMHINLVGSHAIVICASETSNSSNIAIWNLETEDHKHLAKHSGVSTVGACADFRYCLTAQKGDNTLKIWNISKYINQPMPKMKRSLGVAEIHPMIDNPRYAIARQVNHGPISIWNVAKAKCLASAVRIERGLSEHSDVVLIRNCNVVILTEKGLKDSKPVFKTVLIYDLRAKRYVKKITQCFIVPSPAHEYVLLDDETLLGPAETRNHFIIWSLATGKELFRIRPKFKESDFRGGVREADLEHSLQLRASTAKLTPWDRRTESNAARQKRREKAREEERKHLEEILKEKQNGFEQFIISGDLNVIVASFFAHHLCVFNVGSKLHMQTLESESSMLFLHVAALNFDGSCLVHANYDETSKVSYVTLWDTETGQVKKRLKNEIDVLAIAITDDGSRVVFGKANKELRIWDPNKKTPDAMKRIKGYDSLEFGVGSQIFTLNNGKRAVVFAGDISVWDLENATLLAAFTPDTRIEVVNVVMSGQLITIGVHEFSELVVLKISGKDVKAIFDVEHEDLFGETTGDTSDEEEDDEDDDI